MFGTKYCRFFRKLVYLCLTLFLTRNCLENIYFCYFLESIIFFFKSKSFRNLLLPIWTDIRTTITPNNYFSWRSPNNWRKECWEWQKKAGASAFSPVPKISGFFSGQFLVSHSIKHIARHIFADFQAIP
jgi:hypothetical protein